MKFNFAWRTAGVLLAGFAIHATATAQDYPRKPITMVVPYAAGGGTDVVARALAEQMSKQLGQPVIIDNKPGASGILGTNYAAKATPDGYTVLVGLTQSLLTNQFLYDKLPYDPRKELALVTQIATAPLVLLVPASSSVHTVSDLQREMRAASKGGNCGSWGAGSYPHLACAHMAASWKAEIAHVAYKGEAPMLQDLAGGTLSFTIGSVATSKPLIDAGKLRAIAVTGTERMAALPNVPTFAEAGFADPQYRMSGWLALAVPQGTPKPIVARLQQVAQQAIAAPELIKRFEPLGMLPMGTTAEQFRQNYAADWPVWEHLVKVSGAKLD
ncbi:tripartite tricarboxylate transporter substrate binding protein [Variovorax sp. J22R133]|uniref:Bug family tripartite tricarboxylate transporter substrate binding protein n=1 Tax=Variovorax brevis TaxID=3053503 RepID=UPI002576A7C0|nr:tripartite tricarboxylate transporter substrate binding protein [Variovorax sp. J22R133]MDM0112067.1 tripartite tricarboxylate transporter substrate binding protein [Variovorax sp. J22R133]